MASTHGAAMQALAVVWDHWTLPTVALRRQGFFQRLVRILHNRRALQEFFCNSHHTTPPPQAWMPCEWCHRARAILVHDTECGVMCMMCERCGMTRHNAIWVGDRWM